MEDIKPTYEIVEYKGQEGIKCLKCNMTSYHPMDIQEKFCAECDEFHIYPFLSLSKCITYVKLKLLWSKN